MACPFVNEVVDVETQIIQTETVIRHRMDVLSLAEENLHERYRFTSQSIIYLNNLFRPHKSNITHRGFAMTSRQILCIAHSLPTAVFFVTSEMLQRKKLKDELLPSTSGPHRITAEQQIIFR